MANKQEDTKQTKNYICHSPTHHLLLQISPRTTHTVSVANRRAASARFEAALAETRPL